MKIEDYLTESTIYGKTKCNIDILVKVINESKLFEVLKPEQGKGIDGITFYREKNNYRQLINLHPEDKYIQIMAYTKASFSGDIKDKLKILENDVLNLIKYAELED